MAINRAISQDIFRHLPCLTPCLLFLPPHGSAARDPSRSVSCIFELPEHALRGAARHDNIHSMWEVHTDSATHRLTVHRRRRRRRRTLASAAARGPRWLGASWKQEAPRSGSWSRTQAPPGRFCKMEASRKVCIGAPVGLFMAEAGRRRQISWDGVAPCRHFSPG